MRLSTRVSLGIVALAAFAAAVIWITTMGGVFHPFSRSVFRAFQDEALFVAARVEAGESPKRLGEELGVEVRRVRGDPSEHLGRRHPGPRPPVVTEDRDGRRMLFHPGPRNAILIETRDGWIAVQRDIDLERPGRRFAGTLVFGIAVVGLLAFGLGRMATRPLAAAQEGMDRIAEGDLDHRLDEGGPPEIARMARAFNRMADRIDGLLASERQLLAGVSHELRTPLSRLRLELELLRDAGASPSRVDAMEGDLSELDGLIEQLLALSRMQLGQTHLSLEGADLRAVVDEAIGVAQVADIRVEGAATRAVDRALMVRAVGNLLANAQRYGAPPVEVLVRADRVVVRDRGPGVDEAELPHLFEAFWRAEGSRARKTGGLGLGLMLVALVAELHGAEARAVNRPDGGLEIGLYWPS